VKKMGKGRGKRTLRIEQNRALGITYETMRAAEEGATEEGEEEGEELAENTLEEEQYLGEEGEYDDDDDDEVPPPPSEDPAIVEMGTPVKQNAEQMSPLAMKQQLKVPGPVDKMDESYINVLAEEKDDSPFKSVDGSRLEEEQYVIVSAQQQHASHQQSATEAEPESELPNSDSAGNVSKLASQSSAGSADSMPMSQGKKGHSKGAAASPKKDFFNFPPQPATPQAFSTAVHDQVHTTASHMEDSTIRTR
jgi:hypothetical protein